MHRYLLSLVLLMLVWSCSSPLGEVVIDDFNLVRARLNVVRDLDCGDDTTEYIELIIEDKNFLNFELLDAQVSLNGVPLSYNDRVVSPRYFSEDIPIESYQDYTFLITLANGDTASGTVTSGEMYYGEIQYPQTLIQGDDYLFEWELQDDSVRVEFYLFGPYNEETNTSILYTFDQRIEDTGSFTVTGDITSQYPTAHSCSFRLVRFKSSGISSKFRSGSASTWATYESTVIPVE